MDSGIVERNFMNALVFKSQARELQGCSSCDFTVLSEFSRFSLSNGLLEQGVAEGLDQEIAKFQDPSQLPRSHAFLIGCFDHWECVVASRPSAEHRAEVILVDSFNTPALDGADVEKYVRSYFDALVAKGRCMKNREKK